MLTPRGSNHSVLTEEDFALIYRIMKKSKANWIHIFKELMKKSMRLIDYHYPYAILISKFMHYFEIDLEEELSEMVKPSHEVKNGSLSKMGFIQVGGKWVSKDGEQDGSSSGNQTEANEDDQAAANTEDDGVDEHQTRNGDQGNDVPGETYGASLSIGIMDDRITFMTPFETLMITHMDNLAHDERNHHEFCVAKFQNLDEQIEVVQNQLLSSSMARRIEGFHALLFISA